jgi:hypothetical protein
LNDILTRSILVNGAVTKRSSLLTPGRITGKIIRDGANLGVAIHAFRLFPPRLDDTGLASEAKTRLSSEHFPTESDSFVDLQFIELLGMSRWLSGAT